MPSCVSLVDSCNQVCPVRGPRARSFFVSLSLIRQSAGLIVKRNEENLGLDSLLCPHSDRVSILRSAETLQSRNEGGCQQFETQRAKESYLIDQLYSAK